MKGVEKGAIEFLASLRASALFLVEAGGKGHREVATEDSQAETGGGFPSNRRKGSWLKVEVLEPFGFVWSSEGWYPESGRLFACRTPVPPKITVPHYYT